MASEMLRELYPLKCVGRVITKGHYFIPVTWPLLLWRRPPALIFPQRALPGRITGWSGGEVLTPLLAILDLSLGLQVSHDVGSIRARLSVLEAAYGEYRLE